MKECSEIPYYLLSEEFKEEGIDGGRISYYFTSDEGEEKHKESAEIIIKELECANEDDYTRWVHTKTITKKIGGVVGFVSVLLFRIRDSY